MKAISIKDSSKVGRERVGSNDQKWDRVVTMMKARLVEATPSQLRYKWNSILDDFKIVCDKSKKSREGNYFLMSKEERRDQGMPLKLLKEWYDMIESFLGKKHSNEPLCVSKAFDELENESHGPQKSSTTESECTKADHAEVSSKANSGKKKRKKLDPSIDNSAADTLQAMYDQFCSMEQQKIELLYENERIRVDVAKEQVASIREQTRSLSNALGLMANSLGRIADTLQKR
ncbi:hypothetical protein R1flu_026589 [Riccia fluitans]|uniref:Myb-like domain-containing protein n=1 Tax=Riccia fluitans TaxID=41844 RepID=A0ABD1XGE6_9MARC